jgi:hypothetical protein
MSHAQKQTQTGLSPEMERDHWIENYGSTGCANRLTPPSLVKEIPDAKERKKRSAFGPICPSCSFAIVLRCS